MPSDTWADWEQVLSSAAHLQRILPEAVLVGGTAAALYAEHRLSTAAKRTRTSLRAGRTGSLSRAHVSDLRLLSLIESLVCRNNPVLT